MRSRSIGAIVAFTLIALGPWWIVTNVELTKAKRRDGKLRLSMIPNGTLPFMSVATLR